MTMQRNPRDLRLARGDMCATAECVGYPQSIVMRAGRWVELCWGCLERTETSGRETAGSSECAGDAAPAPPRTAVAAVARAVFDLVEEHQMRREPLVLAHVEARVAEVMGRPLAAGGVDVCGVSAIDARLGEYRMPAPMGRPVFGVDMAIGRDRSYVVEIGPDGVVVGGKLVRDRTGAA